MPITETGHAINIDNFRVLRERCETFGPVYDPTNTLISIANMAAYYTTTLNQQNDYLNAYNATKLPINDREQKYKNLKKLVTKVINAYGSTLASTQSLKDARGLVRKITGANVRVKKLEDGTTDPNSVSKSHQSYVQILNNFKTLIGLLECDALYIPNEVSIQIGSLKALATDLENANTLVSTTVASSLHYKSIRDKAIYFVGKGIIDQALMCKKYVKSLYGATSEEYKSVAELGFRRVMRIIE